MAKKTAPNTQQLDLLDVTTRLRTAPCVPAIRQEVEQWQAKGRPGVTKTTKRLLAWWFENDHRTRDGGKFTYYDAQREAIETLIYLWEVKGVRRRGELLLTYAKGQKIALPPNDDFGRYALKMATGSGKTKVMALAMVWQYFNAVRGEGDDYATTFLLIAPNVIVLERLMADFQGGRIFKSDPTIPPDFKIDWDFDVYVRGDSERMRSEGALYLTNIQQLYDKGEEDEDDNPVSDLLGKVPPATLQPVESFIDRIARRGNCLVINDEAHHTHDPGSAWSSVITGLHQKLGDIGLTAQLDFSATPRDASGQLFNWTVMDYPLKQAIIDRVVKRPLKGVAQGITEAQSDHASVRFEGYLVAAVERWLEYKDQLQNLGKKPILFLMLYDTKSADDVAHWLRQKYPGYFEGDKLLIIHTNKTGEISKNELDEARKAAREVDDDTSQVQCIVSVLMLREGWDVNNVTVVVGLRPFSAKANILPEQAVGRGLRLMFRGQGDYYEHVDIIGNDNFMQVVADLEKEEGLKLDTFDYGKKKTALVIQTIQVVTERIDDYDIAIPILTPRVERKKDIRSVIDDLDIGKIKLAYPLKLDTSVVPPDSFTYEGRDVIDDRVIVSREYKMPQAHTSGEIIAFYAQMIAQALKLPTQFAALVPKIEQFLREKAFGQEVDLDSKVVLQSLNRANVLAFTERVFLRLLRPRLTEEREVVVGGEQRWLSTTPPFPWSGKVADVGKTLFNVTPCANDYEMAFAHFLAKAPDVAAFANVGNLTPNLAIEYLDAEANLRYYEPDFVARDRAGVHWLLEPKGREDLDVAVKETRARQWCQDATALTGIHWEYLKVLQDDFTTFKPQTLEELVGSVRAGGPLLMDD
ncbi:MAG: DEAD/DEAH box helicase family protein [Anaerolineae bacterium]